MARIATWEFEEGGRFDGRGTFAEAAPRSDRSLRTGTLEMTATPRSGSAGVLVANGRPAVDAGSFALSITADGGLALSCSTGGVEPVRTKTAAGFVAPGETVRITLSWGERAQLTAVNVSRFERTGGAAGAGYACDLPLRARIRVVPGDPLTFGAAHGGDAPYFRGEIHRVTLSDSIDPPPVVPPRAMVHAFTPPRPSAAQVRPRRVSLPGAGLSPARSAGALYGAGQRSAVITTASGPKPLEEARPGEEVLTRAHGLQRVIWSGSVALDWSSLRRRPHLAPVIVRRGALGEDVPRADLVLPPWQRVVRSVDGRERLQAVRDLAGLDGIFEADALGVSYTHLHCARTEIVQVNGLWMEAVNPAAPSRNGSCDRARAELQSLFPELGGAPAGAHVSDVPDEV